MDLADPGLSDVEHFGDFSQPHILKVVESQNFALHFRQLFQTLTYDFGRYFTRIAHDPHVNFTPERMLRMAFGGHLLEARVSPTLEVIVEESSQKLRRKFDDASGLPLIDLS